MIKSILYKYKLTLISVLFCTYASVSSGQQVQLAVQTGHNSSIDHLVLNTDGSLMASSDVGNHIILWDVRSGSQMANFDMPEMSKTTKINSLLFTNSNDYLLATSSNGDLTIFDIVNSKMLRRFVFRSADVTAGSFSDTTILVSAHNLYFLNTLTWDTIRLNDSIIHGKKIIKFYNNEKNHETYLIDLSGQSYIMDIAGNIKAGQRFNEKMNLTRERQLTNDLRRCKKRSLKSKRPFIIEKCHYKIAVINDKLISLYNSKSSTIQCAEFSDNGNTISLAIYQRVLSYDFNTGKRKFAFTGYYQDEYFNSVAAINIDTLKLLAAGSTDSRIYLYNIKTHKKYDILKGHLSSVNVLSWSKDNDLLISGSDDRSVIFWDTRTWKPLRRLFSRAFPIYCVDISDDGKSMATGNDIGSIKNIDLKSKLLDIRSVSLSKYRINDIRYLQGDSVVIAGGNFKKAYVINVHNWKIQKTYKYRSRFAIRYFRNWSMNLLGFYTNPLITVRRIFLSDNRKEFLLSGQKLYTKKLRTQQVAEDIPYKRFTYPRHRYKLLKNKKAKNISGDIWVKSTRSGLPGIWVGGKKGRIVNSYEEFHDSIFFDDQKNIYLYTQKDKKADKIYTAEEKINSCDYCPANKCFALATADSIEILNAEKKQIVSRLTGYSDEVTKAVFFPDGKRVAGVSKDGTIRIWDAVSGRHILTIIPVGRNEKILITADRYYYAPKDAMKTFGFKVGKSFYSPGQFDLIYNRPDTVLQALGLADTSLIKAFHAAYLKRLKKAGKTPEMLSGEFHLPVTEIIDKKHIPNLAPDRKLTIIFKLTDSKYYLSKYNIWVNEVPYFTAQGIDISKLSVKSYTDTANIVLSEGDNKIEFSCVNDKGAESYKETVRVRYTPEQPVKSRLFVICICVARYKDKTFILKYTVKDGHDMAKMFATYDNSASIDTLFDQNATRENIFALKTKLMQTKIDDEVILYVSGHGLLDKNYDFYFASYDINFENPAERGILYDDLEGLLDGIPARKKLLLMDACHSGEVDKEDIKIIKDTASILDDGTEGNIKKYVRKGTLPDQLHNSKFGLQNSFELMQELFANLTRGSGAVVISAASGIGYALESPEWNNGVFTYCIINGLKNMAANANHDKHVTVTELKDYVSSEVEKLTNGAQKPTSRRESLEFDWSVW